MKNKLSLFMLISIVVMALASCSSAPVKSDSVITRKNRAADFASFGNNYFIQGQYSQALVFFNLAFDENTAADFEPGIARTGNSIGKVYLLTGDFDKAEKHLKDAYNLSKKLGDKELITISAINLADLNLSKNSPEESDKYLAEALSSIEAESALSAEVYHAMAVTERKKDNPELALQHISKAIDINTRFKAHSNLASNYYLAASIYSKQDNFQKAVEMLTLSVQEDRIEENSFGLAKDYKALGIVYLKNNKPEEAYSCFIKSYSIFRIIEGRQEIAGVLQYLIEVSDRLDRPADSAFFKEKLLELSYNTGNK